VHESQNGFQLEGLRLIVPLLLSPKKSQNGFQLEGLRPWGRSGPAERLRRRMASSWKGYDDGCFPSNIAISSRRMASSWKGYDMHWGSFTPLFLVAEWLPAGRVTTTSDMTFSYSFLSRRMASSWKGYDSVLASPNPFILMSQNGFQLEGLRLREHLIPKRHVSRRMASSWKGYDQPLIPQKSCPRIQNPSPQSWLCYARDPVGMVTEF